MTADNNNPDEFDQVVETLEFSPEDQRDIDKLMAEKPEVQYHTLLEVWSKLLEPAIEEAKQSVNPGWASRITQMYPQISIQEMGTFHDLYYSKVEELKAALAFEITTDDDCMSYDNPKTDAEENRNHYKNLLFLWQSVFLTWEHEWDHSHPHAHIEIAAISEVHKMFLGQQGISGFLDQIGFQFDDDDQVELAEALAELKAGL